MRPLVVSMKQLTAEDNQVLNWAVPFILTGFTFNYHLFIPYTYWSVCFTSPLSFRRGVAKGGGEPLGRDGAHQSLALAALMNNAAAAADEAHLAAELKGSGAVI